MTRPQKVFPSVYSLEAINEDASVMGALVNELKERVRQLTSDLIDTQRRLSISEYNFKQLAASRGVTL